VKNTLKLLKVFFSKTIRPISIKLGINYFGVKGIQVFQIKGQILLRGKNHKNAEIGWVI
jgi:hypothetical protein